MGVAGNGTKAKMGHRLKKVENGFHIWKRFIEIIPMYLNIQVLLEAKLKFDSKLYSHINTHMNIYFVVELGKMRSRMTISQIVDNHNSDSESSCFIRLQRNIYDVSVEYENETNCLNFLVENG